MLFLKNNENNETHNLTVHRIETLQPNLTSFKSYQLYDVLNV